jgi:hypothetical protein
MFLYEGDKVQGSISGRYLGVVIKAWQNDALIRGPDGTEMWMGKALLKKVPDQIDGISRVWITV